MFAREDCTRSAGYCLIRIVTSAGRLTVPEGEKRGWRFGTAYRLREVVETESC